MDAAVLATSRCASAARMNFGRLKPFGISPLSGLGADCPGLRVDLAIDSSPESTSLVYDESGCVQPICNQPICQSVVDRVSDCRGQM